MPKRNSPEFYWDEKRKRYRKRIKDKATGKWVSVYGKTKDECRSNAKRRAAELAEAARVKEIPFVFEYAAKWFELYTSEVGEKRKDDYRNAINNHICPVIGGLPITDTKLMANRPEDTIHAVLGAFGAPCVVPNNDENKENVDTSIAFDKGSAPF